jgi:hypothetical protein
MALPNVSGWLIDFRTAKSIFESLNNERIDHCVGLCAAQSLFVCHQEEKYFKDMSVLRQNFIDDQNCICFPDLDVMNTCVNVSQNPLCKKLLKGGETAILLTAIAACKNYGVISDHRSPIFSTVYDLCHHFGIHTFSANEYFALI